MGATISNGTVQLTWLGGTNGPTSPYAIESRGLLSTGAWSRVGTQGRVSGMNTWPSPVSKAAARFYRVAATN